VIEIERMNKHEAYTFALKVYESVLGKKCEPPRTAVIKEEIADSPGSLLAHSDVAGMVYQLIKSEGWWSM
jgi:hypothetical protein